MHSLVERLYERYTAGGQTRGNIRRWEVEGRDWVYNLRWPAWIISRGCVIERVTYKLTSTGICNTRVSIQGSLGAPGRAPVYAAWLSSMQDRKFEVGGYPYNPEVIEHDTLATPRTSRLRTTAEGPTLHLCHRQTKLA